ncbi:hypothetical protein [Branchiibius cervicis]|uniref:Uncharacterized protein n=1 Tax=Branchiibius cervicis TaxID=908252 RepID=A0ABW2AWP1_9MICO
MDDAVTVTPWLSVLYRDDQIRAALEELSNRLELAESAITNSAREETDTALEDLGAEAAEAIEGLTHLIKSEGFSGEREVRTVASVWQGQHIRFRPTARGVASYVELTSRPESDQNHHWSPMDRVVERREHPHERTQLPILSVRSGPLIDFAEHERTLRSFLSHGDLDACKVLKSKLPLR